MAGLRLEVGQTATRSMAVTGEHVRLYSELTGDRNPLYFDPAFTAATRFKRLKAES